MSFNYHNARTTPRLLTATESVRNHPRIVLSGKWLRDWGFATGDRLTVAYVDKCSMILGSSTACCLSEPRQEYASATLNKFRPHPVSVSSSDRNRPKITITGAWLCDWGIAIGDRLSLTRTEEGAVSIKVIVPASEWREVKRKKQLEQELAGAKASLESHKATYPHLYEEPIITSLQPNAGRNPLKVAHLRITPLLPSA